MKSDNDGTSLRNFLWDEYVPLFQPPRKMGVAANLLNRDFGYVTLEARAQAYVGSRVERLPPPLPQPPVY